MANFSHVGADTPDQFRYRLAKGVNVSVGATGNAVAQLTLEAGTSYIVRQITVTNANKSLSTANVAILTTNDGNTSNAVSNNVVLSSVTAASTKYQDLGLATAAATTVYTAGSLYVKVNTGVSGGTCDISVYGEVVTL